MFEIVRYSSSRPQNLIVKDVYLSGIHPLFLKNTYRITISCLVTLFVPISVPFILSSRIEHHYRYFDVFKFPFFHTLHYFIRKKISILNIINESYQPMKCFFVRFFCCVCKHLTISMYETYGI